METFKLFVALPSHFYFYSKLRNSLIWHLQNKINKVNIQLGSYDNDNYLKFFGEELVEFEFTYRIETINSNNKYKLNYRVSKVYDALLVYNDGSNLIKDIIKKFSKENKPIRYL